MKIQDRPNLGTLELPRLRREFTDPVENMYEVKPQVKSKWTNRGLRATVSTTLEFQGSKVGAIIRAQLAAARAAHPTPPEETP